MSSATLAQKGAPQADVFALRQVHVANRLGVAEERVRELRHRLQEGRDWVRRGATLFYSIGAVGRLAAALGAPKVPIIRPLLVWPERHRIVVAKIWPNPRYVGGVVAQGDAGKQRAGIGANGLGAGFEPVGELDERNLLRVRVKRSDNLVKGMVLECVHLSGDLYEAVTLPRRKGRW